MDKGMDRSYELDNEIEIDLKDLFMELLSFWKLILLALVLGAVIAYSVSRFLMVPQYKSTAQLYVLSKSTSITSLADITVQDENPEMAKNIADEIAKVGAAFIAEKMDQRNKGCLTQ